MKKKIYYWSPCLNPVGTITSTINSASSINRYSKTHEAYIINSCGEWDNYLRYLESNSVKTINLTFSYYNFLPKKGFLGSRLSYLIIYLISFVPLLILLKKEKPQILIIHLITSLPLTLLKLFNFETQFILRISGFPKLNFLRKLFWLKLSKKIKMVTCPTIDLKTKLIDNKIFDEDKLSFLPDAIISSDKVLLSRKKEKNVIFDENKKIILGVGRLTKQKNFSYLIDEFKKFTKINDNYILYLIGDGEEKSKLQNKIKENKLEDKVFLLGYKKNVFFYMKKSDIFVQSSLWEEVGFAMVEAAINNSYLICSNCPNGPSEFLYHGQNGILFETNIKDKLFKSFLKFEKLNKQKLFSDKVKLKKKALQYTKFRHFLKIDKIL